MNHVRIGRGHFINGSPPLLANQNLLASQGLQTRDANDSAAPLSGSPLWWGFGAIALAFLFPKVFQLGAFHYERRYGGPERSLLDRARSGDWEAFKRLFALDQKLAKTARRGDGSFRHRRLVAASERLKAGIIELLKDRPPALLSIEGVGGPFELADRYFTIARWHEVPPNLRARVPESVFTIYSLACEGIISVAPQLDGEQQITILSLVQRSLGVNPDTMYSFRREFDQGVREERDKIIAAILRLQEERVHQAFYNLLIEGIKEKEGKSLRDLSFFLPLMPPPLQRSAVLELERAAGDSGLFRTTKYWGDGSGESEYLTGGSTRKALAAHVRVLPLDDQVELAKRIIPLDMAEHVLPHLSPEAGRRVVRELLDRLGRIEEKGDLSSPKAQRIYDLLNLLPSTFFEPAETEHFDVFKVKLSIALNRVEILRQLEEISSQSEVAGIARVVAILDAIPDGLFGPDESKLFRALTTQLRPLQGLQAFLDSRKSTRGS